MTALSDNKIRDLLIDLGLIDPGSIEQIQTFVRDRQDIQVCRCRRSGIIFLSRTDHMSVAHYEQKDADRPIAAVGLAVPVPVHDEDSALRAQLHGAKIRGSRWLDVGTGRGNLLDILGRDAREAVAIEPNAEHRLQARARGHEVLPSLEAVGGRVFDVITLFHVFEHLLDPVGTLKALKALLAPGGILIVEVPHARDFLLDTLDCQAFRHFTFWSEHLILHTRDSLATFARAGGFTDVAVNGMQRYPLANHLHWLARGAPGGHRAWDHLDTADLRSGYAAMLNAIDQTDTLLAEFRP